MDPHKLNLTSKVGLQQIFLRTNFSKCVYLLNEVGYPYFLCISDMSHSLSEFSQSIEKWKKNVL